MDPRDLAEMLDVMDPALIEEARFHYDLAGLAIAARADDRLVACGGLNVIHRGLAIAWLWRREHIAPYGLALARQTRRWLPDLMDLLGVWRVECVVRHDAVEARRFIEFLGCAHECLKRKYGPDHADFDSYVYLKAE
jgi:hypothetical protein